MTARIRCDWAEETANYRAYHDHEWGVPNFDDQRLFGSLSLQTMQAGLTWRTILDKRPAFRDAFKNFELEEVGAFDQQSVEILLQNSAIIRNRKKINAIIHNAQCIIKIREAHGRFANFIWNLIGNKPICNRFEKLRDIPASTPHSNQLAQTLKNHGFKFIGSTICYAFMEINGMINDHLISCPRWREVQYIRETTMEIRR